MDIPEFFEWDEAKAESNLAKHNVPFGYAIRVFLDEGHVVIDASRKSDGEERQKIIGRIEGKVFTVVFTMRGDTCRIISARRANMNETRAYG